MIDTLLNAVSEHEHKCAQSQDVGAHFRVKAVRALACGVIVAMDEDRRYRFYFARDSICLGPDATIADEAWWIPSIPGNVGYACDTRAMSWPHVRDIAYVSFVHHGGEEIVWHPMPVELEYNSRLDEWI